MKKRKSIDELPRPHRLVFNGKFYLEIDAENACFRRGTKYAEIHTAADGTDYIRYNRTTYYFEEAELE